MSKNELLEAYSAGLIGRRAFVRGLVAAGASASAAAAYAVALRPATEASALSYYDPCKGQSLQCYVNAFVTGLNRRRQGGR